MGGREGGREGRERGGGGSEGRRERGKEGESSTEGRGESGHNNSKLPLCMNPCLTYQLSPAVSLGLQISSLFQECTSWALLDTQIMYPPSM